MQRAHHLAVAGHVDEHGRRLRIERGDLVVGDDGRRLTLYADRKQAMVVRLIQARDFTAYPDALRFIIAVKDAGIKVAAASSSKNTRPPRSR